MFCGKIIKNIKIFLMKFSIFASEKNSLYIARASFRNVARCNKTPENFVSGKLFVSFYNDLSNRSEILY